MSRFASAEGSTSDRVSVDLVTPGELADARRLLGAQLAAMRRGVGLTQDQLATKVRWSRSTVANVETGRQVTLREFWAACDVVLGAGELLVLGWARTEALSRRLRDQKAAELIRQRLAQPVPGCVCLDLQRLFTEPGASLPLGSPSAASMTMNGSDHG
ncbi:helix-turn-helix domain-containing protein [Micromonospora inyonensis]|uniref:helix-turn-helix domain-containing protein n=1 Tax=Micromonospora inyonensis TaxID=47866 RepID=UPI000B851864|nr:helix-turn-helix transcriptional regulator [Micromonospora inyonensis]